MEKVEWIQTKIDMDSVDWKGNPIHLKGVPAFKNSRTGKVRIYPTDVAQAEVQKAEAQQANVQLKNQNEQIKTQASAEKGKAEIEIDLLQQRLSKIQMLLDQKNKSAELEFRYWDATERYRIEELRIMTAAQSKDDNSGR